MSTAGNTATGQRIHGDEIQPLNGSAGNLRFSASESADRPGYLLRIRRTWLRRLAVSGLVAGLVILVPPFTLVFGLVAAASATWEGLKEGWRDFTYSFHGTPRACRIVLLAICLGWDRDYHTDHDAAVERMRVRAKRWRR